MKASALILILFLGLSTHASSIGTGDSGGGNLCHGRPLEAFIVDVQNLPAFQHRIAPIIKDLLDENRYSPAKVQMSQPTLGRIFQYAINAKAWYLIGCELTSLPPEKIGSAVQTEQGALQDYQQIWLQSSYFNAMSEEDQAYLILHEMLMAFRILKFDSPREQCRAINGINEKDCQESSTEKVGKLSDINSPDYPDIRAAVVKIVDSYERFDFNDWNHLMILYNFGFWHIFEYPPGGTIPKEYLLRWIQYSVLANYLPSYGFSGNSQAGPWMPAGACNVRFMNPNANELDVAITSTQFTNSEQIDLSATQEIAFGPVFINSQLLTVYSFPYLQPNRKLGEHWSSTSLLFNDSKLAGVWQDEMVCTGLDSDSKCNQFAQVHNGSHYICYDESQLIFK